MRHLVILGGGYGGMRIAGKLLSQDFPDDIRITIVDRLPYHVLKTEFYALAAGTASDYKLRVSFPADERVNTVFGEVSRIDLEQKQVHFADENTLTYNWLVIGLGCEDKYHGIPGASEHAHSIQTISATRKTYESLNNVKPYGQITIVGGGLSGVELAAELRESRADLNIRILDRGDCILSPYPRKLQKYVSQWFREHDVELVSHACVERVEPQAVINSGQELPSDSIVWTAGIQPNRIVRDMDLAKDKYGRILLNEFHQVPDHPDVYVVGDCASLEFAPSAQLAEAQGEQIVDVLQATWKNETPDPLPRIKLKGVLGSLGKKEGFGVMGNKTLIGRVPRVLKSGVLWMYRYHNG
ncbi:MAG: NAD(P)/FAD-dependent oxidoreductase [Bacillaceae bacterium]|nr:NAD(P)/FAD-dependent oxidoreductase [Bacillaceae bacterium]